MAITAATVKELRDATGAGMMDCKKALTENDGDFDAAAKWLREKGIAKAAKRADKTAAAGAVYSYIHMGGKYGVLAEINCETDFVARGEAFQQFCKDICMHICSHQPSPRWITQDEIPQDAIDAELDIYKAQAAESGKPENIQQKMAEGRIGKWKAEVCLMDQKFVKDPDKSISDLLAELTGQCGEKLAIRRFVRYELGEGIEVKEVNFAEEVAAEIAKAEKS
jgi:elongation factor Ts